MKNGVTLPPIPSSRSQRDSCVTSESASYSEYPAGICRCCFCHLFAGYPADTRNRRCNQSEECGLVPTASVRFGSKIRRIGFEHQTVERDLRRHLQGTNRICIRHRSGYRNEHAEANRFPGNLRTSRKGMHDPANPVHLFLAQDIHKIAKGLPAVDEHRQPPLHCQPELLAEGFNLHFPRYIHALVIKADLSDGNRLREVFPEMVKQRRSEVGGMHWVQAIGRKNPSSRIGNGGDTGPVLPGNARDDKSRNSGDIGSGQHQLQPGAQARLIQMTMGVYQHG